MVRNRKEPAAVVKIRQSTHATLQEIARGEDRPMGEIITELVERYQRELFWKQTAEDLARLKQDQDAWQEYRRDVKSLDLLANEGLETEPPFFTPEEEEEIRAELAAESNGR